MGPGNKPNILQLIAGAEPLGAMRRAYDSAGRTVLLRDMVGGALSVYAAALIVRTGGTHVFVAEDRDAAAYLLNDFYALLDERQVYFFPGSYKRSIVYGTEDAQGVVQRTAALSALRREMAAGEYRIICTYPEALAERVTDPDSMRRETVRVKVGDRLAIGELEELLVDSGFTKVDFVYEPGQYSLRGGIFDVFSFSESKPYRLDFFGEEVDSIRRFEISSQLSADRLNEVEIVPNLDGFAGDRISLPAFAGEATYWFFDPDYVLRRVNDLRRKVLGEMEEPAEIDSHLVSRKVLLQDMAGMRLFELRDSLKERPADATIAFRTAPQPKFNKNFELLADDIISNGQRGYKTYILSENRAQLERLENIFYQSGRKEAQINPLPITLHEGFIDHDLKLCFYTDHQIFDRYQRVNVVTWSMGVWVGSLILSNIPQNKILSIAFNGSISPIDNLEGIPLKTYQATLDGLTPASLQKFLRRMCKDSDAYKAFMEITPRRNFDEIKEELRLIKEQYFEMHGSIEKKDIYNEKDEDKFQEYYDKYNYEYDYVFIGNNDRIFPPENLRINNESPVHSNVILTDNAHYDEPMFRFLLQDMWEMTVDDFICHLKTINIDETIEE